MQLRMPHGLLLLLLLLRSWLDARPPNCASDIFGTHRVKISL